MGVLLEYFSDVRSEKRGFKIVRYHEVWCTNVLDPDTWFIFNLHREPFFIFDTHIFKAGAYLLLIKKKRNPLTWEGGPSFMAANSHPLRSHAKSQLPCAPLHFPSPSYARYPHTEL
jgi:hypothetical protein